MGEALEKNKFFDWPVALRYVCVVFLNSYKYVRNIPGERILKTIQQSYLDQ